MIKRQVSLLAETILSSAIDSRNGFEILITGVIITLEITTVRGWRGGLMPWQAPVQVRRFLPKPSGLLGLGSTSIPSTQNVFCSEGQLEMRANHVAGNPPLGAGGDGGADELLLGAWQPVARLDGHVKGSFVFLTKTTIYIFFSLSGVSFLAY